MQALTDIEFETAQAKPECRSIGTQAEDKDDTSELLTEELTGLKESMQRQQEQLDHQIKQGLEMEEYIAHSLKKRKQGGLEGVAKMAQHQFQMKKLVKSVQATERAHQAAMHQISDMQSKMDHMKVSHKEESAALRHRLANSDRMVASVESKMNYEKKMNAELREMLDKVRMEFKNENQHAKDAESELTKNLTQMYEKAALIDSLHETIEQLMHEKDALLAKLVGIQGRVRGKQRRHDVELGQIRQLVADKEREQGRMKSQLGDLKDDVQDGADVRARMAALEKELNLMKP